MHVKPTGLYIVLVLFVNLFRISICSVNQGAECGIAAIVKMLIDPNSLDFISEIWEYTRLKTSEKLSNFSQKKLDKRNLLYIVQ